MSNNKNIYDLALHESTILMITGEDDRVNSIEILRVPGGWIYTSKTQVGESITHTSSFVPFNSEHQQIQDVDEHYTM